MLVLSRHVGESVMLGDNIRVTIISNERGRVRLGFEAPREVPIFRQELWDAAQALKTPGGKPALPETPVLPAHLAG